MEHVGVAIPVEIESFPFPEAGKVLWHLSPAELVEEAVLRNEGMLANCGSLVVDTGEFTGRSPKDKFVVKDDNSASNIWWGEVNRPIDTESFDKLLSSMKEYVRDKDLFVFDGYLGANKSYRIRVRVITEKAWHSLFAYNMFIRESDKSVLKRFKPDFLVIDLPGCKADPSLHNTRSETFIVLNFTKRMVLIGGTLYGGEIKKSMFTVMNYYLPLRGALSMHCSCNYGDKVNDVALFFGLSGTGKTTLSSDKKRVLVGDDEHGWVEEGIFNFEGGCYAKVIRLNKDYEPEIFNASTRFGAILENVLIDKTREIDFDSDTKTENTRSSYPLYFLNNIDTSGLAGTPKNVIFLTADAFGILPPVARLNRNQIIYYFLSGYTAKVAGTERGITDPVATFSACFGAPFLPLHPTRYAEMLVDRIAKYKANVWLINTGWSRGGYGRGERIPLPVTRRIVDAVLTGELAEVKTETMPVFNLSIPTRIDGVPKDILFPWLGWSSQDEYKKKAEYLAAMFKENISQFEGFLDKEVLSVIP